MFSNCFVLGYTSCEKQAAIQPFWTHCKGVIQPWEGKLCNELALHSTFLSKQYGNVVLIKMTYVVVVTSWAAITESLETTASNNVSAIIKITKELRPQGSMMLSCAQAVWALWSVSDTAEVHYRTLCLFVRPISCISNKIIISLIHQGASVHLSWWAGRCCWFKGSLFVLQDSVVIMEEFVILGWDEHTIMLKNTDVLTKSS